jgi:hypothetical protein
MASQKLARIRQNNERTENPQANTKSPVGASMLAKKLKDNTGYLMPPVIVEVHREQARSHSSAVNPG